MALGSVGGAAALFGISPELLQKQNETTSQGLDPLSAVPMSTDRIDSRTLSGNAEPTISRASATRLESAMRPSSAAASDTISIGQDLHRGGAQYASASDGLGTYNGHPLKRGPDGRVDIELPDGSLIHAPSTAGTFNDTKIDDHTDVAHRTKSPTRRSETEAHPKEHDSIALSGAQPHHARAGAQQHGAATTLSPATHRSQSSDLRDARDHVASSNGSVTHVGAHSSTVRHATASVPANLGAGQPHVAQAVDAHADVSKTSVVDRATSTMAHGLAIAAYDAGGEIKKTLSDPKTVAMIGVGTAAAIGVQFVPIVGEAVDVAAGVAGAAMYAAAGPEHKARIGQAVGELKSYLHDVSTAKTQGDLDRASRHFAKFVELGGQEAVDGLTAIAGAAAAPAKFASLAAKVGELGGAAGIAAAAARNSGRAFDAIKSGAADLIDDARRGIDDLGQGVQAALQPHGPQFATAGANGYGNGNIVRDFAVSHRRVQGPQRPTVETPSKPMGANPDAPQSAAGGRGFSPIKAQSYDALRKAGFIEEPPQGGTRLFRVPGQASLLRLEPGARISTDEAQGINYLFSDGKQHSCVAQKTQHGAARADLLFDGVQTDIKTVQYADPFKAANNLKTHMADSLGRQGNAIFFDARNQPGLSQRAARSIITKLLAGHPDRKVRIVGTEPSSGQLYDIEIKGRK